VEVRLRRKEIAVTATQQPEATSPSRRALLAGAIGGLGAWAASAIGRASPARATDGDTIHVGDSLTAASSTTLTNSTTGLAVFSANSTSGFGIYGSSSSTYGVVGISSSSDGVHGVSTSSSGVRGQSDSATGVRGISSSGTGVLGDGGTGFGVVANSSGTNAIDAYTSDPTSAGVHAGSAGGSEVVGYSGAAVGPKSKTGVYGSATQDNFARGVTGETTTGVGVYGIATTGYGGYFAGKVYTTKWYEMTEITAPPAPGLNRARLFLKDNGLGKTQLCVRFNTGAVAVLATQA
jgi:hypothetical protein